MIRRETLLRRVLVAVDRISAAEKAIDWVRLILPEARLVLGQVIEPAYVPIGDFGVAYVPYLHRKSEKALHKISGRVAPRPRIVIREGFPAGRLAEIAVESGSDLICLVSRGGSPARRRLLGGTVEQLLHGTKVPLLVIPASCGVGRRKPRLRKILVPLDGRETSERILTLIQPIAARHRATVALLHCSERARPGDAGAVLKHLRTLATGLRRNGIRARSMVVKGECVDCLERVSLAEGADLMAMAVHGHSSFRHLVFGAKASRILQRATLPVLVMRHDATVAKMGTAAPPPH